MIISNENSYKTIGSNDIVTDWVYLACIWQNQKTHVPRTLLTKSVSIWLFKYLENAKPSKTDLPLAFAIKFGEVAANKIQL